MWLPNRFHLSKAWWPRGNALLLTIVVLVVACEQSGELPSSSENETSQRPTVALIMKSLANEFFVTMAEGAKAHQEKHSDQYLLIVNGIKNEVDLAQQVALIDQMVAARVDAIVISPADSKAVVPALARARDAGISIINIDNRLDADALNDFKMDVPFVGPDNFRGAEMVGDFLGTHLPPAAAVAIIEGVPTAFNSRQRTAGFRQAMDNAGMSVVAQQSAQWDQTTAVTVTSALLVKHPELNAVLCANDNSALGAVAAIEQAGKRGQVQVVGYDNISAVQKLIRSGDMLATVDQHADLLAVYGIERALEALQTDEIPEDRATPLDLVTATTLGGH
ncbi:MAG: sugar ABC transporter substrate-binding protein [Gammaproteobacteria bacterium]